MARELTEKQIAIREKFYQDRGKWKWNDIWQTILELNEDVLEAYSTLSSVAHKKGYLTPQVKELIYCAVDAAVTQLYIPGMVNHIRHAVLDVGVRPEELMEAFVIASSIGAATYTESMDILVRELEARGMDTGTGREAETSSAIKERFVKKNGWWSDTLENIARLDPEMFEAYLDYVDASAHGAIDEKTRELIFIGVCAAPTTLNNAGTAVHIRRALDLGATKEEIIEVFESVCCISIHSVIIGIPALRDVMNEAGIE